MSQADVRSFQSVAAFRVALATFADRARAALEEAESQGQRCVNWLETEMRPHWKAARRAAAEDLARAQDAYRQKSLFKDATGARQSAVDELREVRRCEARVEDCERRGRATQRHIVSMKQELQAYRGATGRLRNLIAGDVPLALADLADAIGTLERYALVRPAEERRDAPRPASRPPAAEEELPDDKVLSGRTPSPKSRAAAPAGKGEPPLPDVPPACRAAVADRVADVPPPGRYDLLTIALPPAGDLSELNCYLDRAEPAGDADTGWHLGSADRRDPRVSPATLTYARLARAAPYVADLLRLPAGTLVVARGGTVVRVIDGLGRTLWEADE